MNFVGRFMHSRCGIVIFYIRQYVKDRKIRDNINVIRYLILFLIYLLKKYVICLVEIYVKSVKIWAS